MALVLSRARESSRRTSLPSLRVNFEKKKPTLRYFDAAGAAEVIRTIFAAAEVEYNDYRYTFSMDGPKPQICDQHGVDKESGVFDANLMRLPILEVGSEQIGQSRAIERYVAKDLGLMGKGKIQEAQIDAYCEHIRDLRDAYNKVRGNPFAPATPEIEEAEREVVRRNHADVDEKDRNSHRRQWFRGWGQDVSRGYCVVLRAHAGLL